MKVLVLSSRTGRALHMLNDIYPIHAAVSATNVPRGILAIETPRTKEQWEKILSMYFDVVISLGFMKHIPRTIFENVPTLNVHPGKLPDFKGRDPHIQALRAKVDYTAVTIHKVIEELDSGEVVVEVPVRISSLDYPAQSFEDRLRHIAVLATAAFLYGLEGR